MKAALKHSSLSHQNQSKFTADFTRETPRSLLTLSRPNAVPGFPIRVLVGPSGAKVTKVVT
jgi:hypothetical protein